MEYVETGPMYKKFAWWPVKTTSGKFVWFRTVYAQHWSVELGPGYMSGTRHYTADEAIMKRLSND